MLIRTKRTRFIGLLCTGVLVLGAGAATFTVWYSNSRNSSTSSGASSRAVTVSSRLRAFFTLEELCTETETIVYGKVVSVGQGVDGPMDIYNDPDLVITPVTLEVYKVYKGEPSLQTYNFALRGGETSSKAYIDEDPSPLSVGDEVIFFTDYRNYPKMPTAFEALMVNDHQVEISEFCKDPVPGKMPFASFELLLQEEISLAK